MFVGGNTQFLDSSTAGNAILIANGSSVGGNGGAIVFADKSTGGTARVEVFGNGYLDVSSHAASGLTIGSLEGSGKVFLGANNLAVGSNDLSTTFSGVMQDGGQAGVGTAGSVTKIGNGTLTLSGANTYTGSTTVNAGGLIVNGSITSAVTVNGGKLGGSGTTGSVIVNKNGKLAPGNSAGILNVSGNLTLTLGATYLVDVNGAAVGTEYDQTNVTGVVSLGNAALALALGFAPVNGTMFRIIENDGADAITGTFNGLAEGSTFDVSGHAFTISYHGGDGNDVVVTSVVPEPAIGTLLGIGSLGVVVLRGVKSRFTISRRGTSRRGR
jgi:autotransporter-associated beta strand protein